MTSRSPTAPATRSVTAPGSRSLPVLALVATVAAACGGDLSSPDRQLDAGAFELEVTGSVARTMEGTAASRAGATSDVADTAVWILELDDGANQVRVVLGSPDLPTAASYDIERPPSEDDSDVLADSTAYVVATLATSSSGTSEFASEGGTLVVEDASGEEVTGRLEFRTSAVAAGDTSTVFGAGAFRSDPTAELDGRVGRRP